MVIKKKRKNGSQLLQLHESYKPRVRKLLTRSQTPFIRVMNSDANLELFSNPECHQPPHLQHLMTTLKGHFGCIPRTIVTTQCITVQRLQTDLENDLDPYKKYKPSPENHEPIPSSIPPLEEQDSSEEISFERSEVIQKSEEDINRIKTSNGKSTADDIQSVEQGNTEMKHESVEKSEEQETGKKRSAEFISEAQEVEPPSGKRKSLEKSVGEDSESVEESEEQKTGMTSQLPAEELSDEFIAEAQEIEPSSGELKSLEKAVDMESETKSVEHEKDLTSNEQSETESDELSSEPIEAELSPEKRKSLEELDENYTESQEKVRISSKKRKTEESGESETESEKTATDEATSDENEPTQQNLSTESLEKSEESKTEDVNSDSDEESDI